MFDKILKRKMKTYLGILEVLERYKNEEGISKISQKGIGDLLNISQALVDKKIKVLYKYGAVEKAGKQATYRVLHNDVNYTPYGLVLQMKSIQGKLEGLPYNEQAAMLNTDVSEVCRAMEYIREVEEELLGA